MPYLDIRGVYKNRNTQRVFQKASYFLVKYTNDCPICLFFMDDPKVLPCGHCYCNLCISRSIDYTNNCPMCGDFFWIFKPVKFFFVDEVAEEILFKKCNEETVSNIHVDDFFSKPYSLCYFEETGMPCEEIEYVPAERRKAKKQDFYQVSDGQLYFLDPAIVRGYKSKPEYIFCRVKHRFQCFVDYKKYPELSHIPSGVKIVIVVV